VSCRERVQNLCPHLVRVVRGGLPTCITRARV
jgi:hypothetical protein